jgi:prevent-host-death family protein
MLEATISQLKNGLSAYLKRVRGGETVIVLDRQEPIAMLEPIDARDRPQGRLARLEQAGALHRSRTGDPLAALGGTEPPESRRSVLQALLQERSEGR